MAETKIPYKIITKDKRGIPNTIRKNMTRKQYDNYYDEIVSKGGKVIGVWTDEDSE